MSMNISEMIEQKLADRVGAKTTKRKDIADYWESCNIAVDVKSNNVNKTNFSPNLVSCRKVYDFLSNERNQLKFIFVDYKLIDNDVEILNETEVFIEEIDWDCLSIQNQGTGVIQKSKPLKRTIKMDRQEWLGVFREKYSEYVDRQHEKLENMKNLIAKPQITTDSTLERFFKY